LPSSQILSATDLNLSRPDFDYDILLPETQQHRLTFSFSYCVERTRSCRHGKRAFLFCHNVFPSCCVTIQQFCHNTC